MASPASESPSKNSMRPRFTAVDRCWALPFVSACSSFLYSMPQMNSGILFVLFMEKFGVSRETALWPRTIDSMMNNVMGFVVGSAQKKFSVYSMIMMGACVCPLSIIVSAFVPNMLWMSVTMGFLYGASLGILGISTSIYIVSYFEDYRGLATGITLVGVSFTGIVGPLLLSQLTLTYGLFGAIIVIGGLMLNLIPLTLVIKNPRPYGQYFSGRSKMSGLLDRHAIDTHYGTMQKVSDKDHFQFISQITCGKHDPLSKHKCRNGCICGDNELYDSVNVQKRSGSESLNSSMTQHSETSDGVATQAYGLLQTPCFYALAIAMVAAKFTFHVFNSTVVDYALNKGMSLKSAAELVTCCSVGGLCGHLLIPFVADKLAINRCAAATLSFAVAAVSFIGMPHLGLFVSMGTVTFANGVQQGCLRTLKPVLVADYLGAENVAVAWGIMGLMAMPLTFCEPMIVGMFRDKGGSYDNLYRMCGAVDLLAAFLLALQVCFDAKKRRRKEESLLHG